MNISYQIPRSRGKVGVAAIAFSVDTVATLDRVIIAGVKTPTQELPVGAIAEVSSYHVGVKLCNLQQPLLTDNSISFSLRVPAFADLVNIKVLKFSE